MANPQEPDNEVHGVTRRRLLRTVSTAAVIGLQSALAGSKATAATLSPGNSASALMGPRPTKKLRMGVVGGGFGAGFYWHAHPDCEVTAGSDMRDGRRKRLLV